VEKSIFFFNRHPDRSPDNFEHHYINNHAVLGKRLTRCLLGYTVNLRAAAGWPAAVTEHWVSSVMDLLTPAIAYENMDDFNAVFVDDQSMFQSFDLYVITDETLFVNGAIPPAPLEKMTPGVKMIERFDDCCSLPPPHPKAVRVVDNTVSHKLALADDFSWNKVDPGMRVIRMSWFKDVADVGEIEEAAWLAQEYRFIAPRSWPEA